jgi:hypothetical protein
VQVAEPPALAWIGGILFTASCFWAVIGGTALALRLQKRGVSYYPFGTVISLLRFPFLRPRSQYNDLDRLALSVAIADIVCIGTVVFLGRYMWPAAFEAR